MDKLSLIRDFIREISQIWTSEKPTQMAAALAYYGIFSFAAVVYIAYRLAGFFINETAAAEQFYARLTAAMGPEMATFIKDSVAAISAVDSGGSWIITLVSLGSLLFAAMGLFLNLKFALNRLWGVPLTPRGQKWAFLRQELFSFLMVISLGLLIILATIINVVFAWFGSFLQDFMNASRLIATLNTLALLGLIALANAFIYKILPDVKIHWRDVWLGSAAATLLMVLGGLVVGLYFRLGGVHSAFQAAGAFAVLMIAIYYFAQIFLFGAIVIKVYAHKYGSLRGSLSLEPDGRAN